jgi:hypothetical protein
VSKTFIENKALVFLKDKSDWILKHIDNNENKISSNTDLDNHSRNHYLKYKQEARLICENKAKLWSDIM